MLAAETLLRTVLLRTVQTIVPAVSDLTLPDLGDPTGWILHGLITADEGRRAFGIIQAQLAGPASRFPA
jgi:hypothetical protein